MSDVRLIKISWMKFLLIMAQILPFILLIEYAFNHTIWIAFPSAASIVLFSLSRCSVCKLGVWEKEIVGKRVPIRPSRLESCGNCGSSGAWEFYNPWKIP